ncbi:unnamed protein product [Vicia faba]|uniref:Pectinesterase inhibitor domain-containing protein n=1 Tax=Vicia faba TaxID=3906 RepID=A0AAV0YWS8_VICFA|nr:unnamed protein product [Vicia faba]
MAFAKIHLALLIVSISILLAPTTHALFAPITHAVGRGGHLATQTHIFKMCKPTSYPLLCYKTLLPKALVTPRFNIHRALEVEVQAAQTQVIKTVTSIETHLSKPGTSKDTVDCLVIWFEESEITSPIADDAKAVNDLSTNCLDLAKAIVNKSGKVRSA